MLLYPGGTLRDPSTRGYSFFQNSLSDLGSTVAWGGQSNSPGSLLFLCAFATLAVAGGACVVVLVGAYSSSARTRSVARTGGVAGLVSCLGLLGAALTPGNQHPTLHGMFSQVALGALVVVMLLFALATTLDGRFRRRVPLAWLALTLLLLAWMAAMRWPPTSDLQLAVPVTLQKLVAASVLVHTRPPNRITQFA